MSDSEMSQLRMLVENKLRSFQTKGTDPKGSLTINCKTTVVGQGLLLVTSYLDEEKLLGSTNKAVDSACQRLTDGAKKDGGSYKKRGLREWVNNNHHVDPIARLAADTVVAQLRKGLRSGDIDPRNIVAPRKELLRGEFSRAAQGAYPNLISFRLAEIKRHLMNDKNLQTLAKKKAARNVRTCRL